MSIQISPRDVETLSVNIFKTQALSVKFKVKLWATWNDGSRHYYHQEYLLSNQGSDSVTLSLDFNPFIQIQIGDNNNKDSIMMRESERERFMKKAERFIGLIRSYNNEVIDLLEVSDNGLYRIPGCFRDISSVSMSINKKKVNIEAVIRDMIPDVGVFISIEDSQAVISSADFMNFIYRINDLNYMSLGMELVNYFNSSSQIGKNINDLRSPTQSFNGYNEITSGGLKPNTDFDDLKIIRPNHKPNW